MILVDTHTHLYAEEFSEDIASVISRAKENHVMQFLLPDIDRSTRESMFELHRKYPNLCLPMIGLHPTSVKEDYKVELDEIQRNLAQFKFCGIGETGIDLYWDKTFIHEQIESFDFHVELSIKHDLPLVIHSRKSLNEIFLILKKHVSKKLAGVFHCFPGNIKEAERAVEMGFYLGIGGVVTYKNSTMAEVVRHIGLEHLVLETDAPYLTPVPHRGKRNESAYIPLIADYVAQLKKTSIVEVAEITSANAKKLFSLDIPIK
jgi:TatD DNase family protein